MTDSQQFVLENIFEIWIYSLDGNSNGTIVHIFCMNIYNSTLQALQTSSDIELSIFSYHSQNILYWIGKS